MDGRLRTSLLCVAVVSSIFLAAMALLCARDVYILISQDPLLSPELMEARSEALASPDDAGLRSRVTTLDASARRAHFILRHRTRRAVVLMALAALVLLVSLKWFATSKKRTPRVERGPIPTESPSDSYKARSIIIGVALWSLAGGFLYYTFFAPEGEGGASPATPPKGNPYSDSLLALRYDKPVWPSFRGPRGNAKALNAVFSWKGKVVPKPAWAVDTPKHGYSSPIIVGESVYLTGGDKTAREVYSFSTETGELLWRKVVPFFAAEGAEIPEPTDDTGFAAPTMASDGERVFAIFATGDLAAFSLDGKPLWRMNPGVPENHYAYSSSLAVADGKLIVQLDHAENGVLLALDTVTGAVLWRTKRDDAISWASPTIAETADSKGKKRLTVFLASSATVTAYDVENGDSLWGTECLSGEVAPSPAYESGRVFVANDTAAAVALDAATGKVLWSVDDVDLPDVSSPLATPTGRVYLAASFGTLTCLDAKTGATLWSRDFKEGFYASPILVGGGLVCLLDLKGNIFLIQDADKFNLVAEAAVGGETAATPAFHNGFIYIRQGKKLLKIPIR